MTAFRFLLVACAVLVACPLLSVSGFFALNSPQLVIERLDPLVNPGGIAGHLHTVLGGSNWSDKYEYDTSFASDCTTMPVSVDKSNYWTPTLYYVHPDQSQFEVVPLGFGRIYYLPRPGPKKQKIVAFPKGFRMVAGDMNRRYFNASRTQDKAISFVCLDYYNSHKGDVEWDQRNDFFTKHNCPNGMRLQFNFPACWDGKNLYKNDNSHVAYTIQNVDGGDCPDSHPVHFVNLFFEFIYDTQKFPINPTGTTWALSNGDTTGYGFHGDFTNGWDVDVLQAALDQCDDAGGDPAKCAPFQPYLQNGQEFCKPAKNILNEQVGLNGKKIPYLPGCNKLWYGTGPKPECAADWPGLVHAIGYEPAKSVLPDNWVRLGCYADPASGNALTGAFIDLPDTNSGAVCATYCQSLNFSIAVVKYTHQCYCGSALANGASLAVEAPANSCSSTCPGRYTETCGGNNFFNAMINPAMRNIAPSASKLPAGFFRDGCVAQPSGGKLLQTAKWNDDNMTPARCVAFCADISKNGKGNFSVAGTEYARECSCANAAKATPTFNAAATPRVPSAQCSMSCAGEQNLQCGGPNFLSLYTQHPEWKVAAQNASALPNSWSPLGCFRLGVKPITALTASRVFVDAGMTNAMCAARCARSSTAAYAVVQYGVQCFCGTAASLSTQTRANLRLAPEQCDSICGGNQLERCGGSDTSSVMLTGAPGTGAGADRFDWGSDSTGTAQPVGPEMPVETPVVLRLRVRMAAADVTSSWLAVIRDLVAGLLGVDSYRVTVAIDTTASSSSASSSASSSSSQGRRLLADAAAESYVKITLQPASASSYVSGAPASASASVSDLALSFLSKFGNPADPLYQGLTAQSVDTSSAPVKVTPDNVTTPPDAQPTSDSSSSKKKTAIIVGVVVGAAVLIAIAATATVLVLRKRKAAAADMSKMHQGQHTSGTQMSEAPYVTNPAANTYKV